MKCPHCGSEKIQSHIIVEDKRTRNAKIITCVFLGLIAIMCLISLAGGIDNVILPAIVGIFIAMPICLVLRVVLIFIPARQKTVFVCNSCGRKFNKYTLTKTTQTENTNNT